jgi:hypothetical protein
MLTCSKLVAEQKQNLGSSNKYTGACATNDGFGQKS